MTYRGNHITHNMYIRIYKEFPLCLLYLILGRKEGRQEMDFLDRLIDYIELKLDLEVPIEVGKLSEDETAISIRPTPSSTLSRSYDKGTTFEYTFQILAKNPNQFTTINTVTQIAHLLDGLSNGAIKSSNDSFIFVKSEIYIHPHYVETLDHGETVYSAMVTAELEKGGN